MITKLNKKQKENLSVIKDKWLNKIFNYELYNSMTNESVSRQMKELYKFCGLKEPKVILVGSPLACQIAVNLFLNKNEIGNKITNEAGNEVENKVWIDVEKKLKKEVGNEVKNEVEKEIKKEVRNIVRNEIWIEVTNEVEIDIKKEVEIDIINKVRNKVGNEVKNGVENKVRNKKLKYCHFSSYVNYSDFGWLSFYEYFLWNTNILDKYKDKLNFIIDCVDNSFMSIQLNGLCIVSKYPKFISRNSNKQLHNINGYAIKFEDGYGQYYFNGININPNLFNKLISKSYTFEEWANESNEEIKSLVLAFYEEKFGGEFVFRFISKYLKEINTYVDKKSEEYLKNTVNSMNIGVYTLFKGTINNTDIAYVRCYCPSTDRMFFLGVNPSYNNAKDAIASLCQIPRILKDNLISINRQGEIFSFNFDEEGTKLLKDNLISKEDLNDVISLTGDEYFSKIKFEY